MIGLIKLCWGKDTSNSPNQWTPDRPSVGQCAVTALVIQDLFGGTLIRAKVHGQSHYWNVANGQELDLTRDQFESFEPEDQATRTREYVLSFEETKKRYEILKARVAETLLRERAR